MTGDGPDLGWWAPIVYARTRDVDVWWRALPAQMSIDGPEAAVLDATVAGDGVRAPRFVLARLASGTLLGVACQTHQISADMRDGGRPVPCFVAWLSTDRQVPVPQFEAVQNGWLAWAAQTYETWMRPVWTESASRVRVPDRTSLARPPWELTAAPDADPGDRSGFEEPARDRVRIYSATAAPEVWRGVARYGVNATVVTGWDRIQTALHFGLTHACVAEFEGPPEIHPLRPDRPAGETRSAGRGQPSALGQSGRGDPYAGSGSGYSRKPPAQPGGGSGYSYTYGSDPTFRSADPQREPSGLPRLFSGLRSHLPGGHPAPRRPPAPPGREHEWTLRRDQGVFRAYQDGYVFSYRIGDPAIMCWYEGSEQAPLQWTSAGWAPLASARPSQSESRSPVAPQPAPSQPEPHQQWPPPTGTGYQAATVTPPKVAGRPTVRLPAPEPTTARDGAGLDEFEDAPLPESRPALPDDAAGGEASAPAQAEWSTEEE